MCIRDSVKRFVEQAVGSDIIFNNENQTKQVKLVMSKGIIKKVAGPLVIAEGMREMCIRDRA